MKLRNKKTGKIEECVIIPVDENGYPNEYRVFEKGGSLAELNEEWEDYEEHKKGWYLDELGHPIKIVFGGDSFTQILEAIGNYFETKEEAEKAVEKLKAWKRLKDKGFRFDGWTSDYGKLKAWFKFDKEAWATETDPDLDLLFGGEE